MSAVTIISALLTDEARHLRARSETEGVLIGDWYFQVGSGGFNPLTPDEANDVDPTATALISPIGGNRFLGRLLDSNIGASVVLSANPGFLVVNGIALPNATSGRWLRLSGSTDPNINGTWVISQWLSASSIEICNPLATAPDAGPLTWEFRERCVQHPNPRSAAFYSRLDVGLLTADPNGVELGEVGIFGRVIRSPVDPSLLGSSVLYANCHFPSVTKVEQMRANWHIAIQE